MVRDAARRLLSHGRGKREGPCRGRPGRECRLLNAPMEVEIRDACKKVSYFKFIIMDAKTSVVEVGFEVKIL